MRIDLRSDTVTKPTAGMLEAMMAATVGDDVFGDDPAVNQLEEKAARLFGMESALFCASGTMTNQLAIKVHTFPGSEVICDELSHIYLYEGGGVASNSFSSVKLLSGDRGRINAAQVKDAINNPEDIHLPVSSMVSVENTMNKGGGAFYNFSDFDDIKEVCQQNGLVFHLDGARLFNALVETGETPLQYGETFDSISICLSKGLGCPVGSLLLGTHEMIRKARRFRKSMGGGWRQAGFLAAAGIYALDHHVERLKQDHERAKVIGKELSGKSYIRNVYPIDTNIIIFEPVQTISPNEFVSVMKSHNVHMVTFGKNLVRMVTHLDFDDDQLTHLTQVLKQVF